MDTFGSGDTGRTTAHLTPHTPPAVYGMFIRKNLLHQCSGGGFLLVRSQLYGADAILQKQSNSL